MWCESTFSQGRSLDLVGYLIDGGNNFYFQPCNDSAISLTNSLNNGSFRLEFDPEGVIYPEGIIALKLSGKKMQGSIHWGCDTQLVYRGSIGYYFCRIKLNIPSGIKVYSNTCPAILTCDGRTYKFDGLTFINALMSFEPLREIDKNSYNEYLMHRNK